MEIYTGVFAKDVDGARKYSFARVGATKRQSALVEIEESRKWDSESSELIFLVKGKTLANIIAGFFETHGDGELVDNIENLGKHLEGEEQLLYFLPANMY